MKAFIRPPHPHALLAALLALVFAGATLLPVSGAESKSKKSSTKSSASSASKKKAATSKSKSKTAKSTPKKKSAKASPKKKSSTKSTSKSTPAKATPEPKPEKDASSSKPAESGKPGIPGQPAPELPVRDPESGKPSVPSPSDVPASELSPGEKAEKTSADNNREEAKPASVVSLSPEDLLGFEEQPARVQELIRAALNLTGEKLTYTFGSSDPAKGGMDCSGAIQYLLKKQGFDEVPRDASGQYVWARKSGKFFAVVSKKADSFEFGDLLPGDLLFWNGTYDVDRDPPVTHTMIYLGVQRKRAQHVMWGSSDGRTYDNKARCGVSVFDFKMPGADKNLSDGAKADFLGYARIPGLRD